MMKAFVGAASAMALFAGVAVANAQTVQGTSPTAPANQSMTAPSTGDAMTTRDPNAVQGNRQPITCAPGTNDPRCAAGAQGTAGSGDTNVLQGQGQGQASGAGGSGGTSQ
jgi:hypothetical protein